MDIWIASVLLLPRFLLSLVLPWLKDLDSDLIVVPGLDSQSLLASLGRLYSHLDAAPLRQEA